MRLAAILLEGQIYLAALVAIFAAELLLLAWGVWSRRPIVGLVAIFVALPLIRRTVAVIRACLFTVKAPNGYHLGRDDGRALYAVVDAVSDAVDVPHVDGLVIANTFVASAAAYREGWTRRSRRVLIIGLPVLATLSTPELRAVIAHELAHFSRARDRYAAWVYRTRRSWRAVLEALNERRATPLYVFWLVRWYVPRLDAASSRVARRCEFLADGVAAALAGSRVVGDALVAFEAGARYASDTYWPAVGAAAESDADLPRPFSGMLNWTARDAASETLDELLAGRSSPNDSHPSLQERLAALDVHGRVPPPLVSTAGAEILGTTLTALADRLDGDWQQNRGREWRRRHDAYLDARRALARLMAQPSITPAELYARAELVERLESAGAALPIYHSAADAGHPGARLEAGRLLLDRRDPRGVALIESAMDADERLVPRGCRILVDYFVETKQELAAHQCEWRATAYQTRAHLAGRDDSLIAPPGDESAVASANASAGGRGRTPPSGRGAGWRMMSRYRPPRQEDDQP
jgi:Zn-dependent protease with chaperone function